MIKTIAFDADDTLWHNETQYEQAQDRLKTLLSNFADGETVAQRLYKTEMGNIDLYGYGIKSFTLSMIEAAITISGGKITGTEMQKVIGFGKDMLTARVQLIGNVKEIIGELAQLYELMVITKGDLLDQHSKLMQSGINHHFKHVEVVSRKTAEMYAALLEKYNVGPQHFLMVGNSLRSDILPVVAVGGHAVHIPYHITWAHEVVKTQPSEHDGYHELENLGQLPGLLERLNHPE